MSVDVADCPRVIVAPVGPVIVPDDFCWSDLPAGGWIGDELSSMPLEKVTTAELRDAARVWEKLSAWVAGNQARVLAEFDARREAEIEADIREHGLTGEARDLAYELNSAADEVSLALTVSPGTATWRMGFARDLLDRLPATVAAMITGAVSWSKAKTILNQTEDLTPEQTAELEAMILGWGVGKTPGQVRDKLYREIQKLDPQAAARRRQKAVKKRGVGLNPQRDGMADLWIHLPGPDAVAVYNWLDQHARAMKAAGDGRTLDQLRADALVDLVTGRSDAVARKPLIRVLVPAGTLAGGDEPGELAGYGPIDAALTRELAADGTWQRFLTDPATGALKDIDPTKYVPSPALKAYVQARDRTCRFPTCNQPAHRCDIDHTVPFYNGKEPGTEQNPGTVPANLSALCRRHHRLKDSPISGWQYRHDTDGRHHWTTPTGHTYSPDPPVKPRPQSQSRPEPQPTTDPNEPPPF
ncbi:MAG TPA: DUF222 domain-containing protein [Mycobacteriales bacterium]|nr:DUF222 domain-containing protein [Mycobacteriales bacterium]